MKVYVIKNDKNEYMTETGDFINSLWQAEIFYDFECAYVYAPIGCNIVECSLMEKYQLADYIKQVREELLQELKIALREKIRLMQSDEHCYPENAIDWHTIVDIINKEK